MKELREETDRLLLPLFEVLDCCCLPSQAMCLPTTQECSKSQRERKGPYNAKKCLEENVPSEFLPLTVTLDVASSPPSMLFFVQQYILPPVLCRLTRAQFHAIM